MKVTTRPATAILVRETWNKDSRETRLITCTKPRTDTEKAPEQAPEGVYATSPATKAECKRVRRELSKFRNAVARI